MYEDGRIILCFILQFIFFLVLGFVGSDAAGNKIPRVLAVFVTSNAFRIECIYPIMKLEKD